MRADSRGNAISIGRFVGDPTVVSLSVASASVALKPMTFYAIWSSVDAFFKFGAGATTATTSSHPLKGGLDRLHVTDELNLTLAAVVATGTGTLYVSELDTSQV